MHPNQMYVRYTQLGGRAILWLSGIAFAAFSVHFFLGVGPLTPGAVFLSAMVLSHFAAARILRRRHSPTWVELGRPGLIPSFGRGGLARLLWAGTHRDLRISSVSLAAACFNLATIGTAYWLLSLAVRFACHSGAAV